MMLFQPLHKAGCQKSMLFISPRQVDQLGTLLSSTLKHTPLPWSNLLMAGSQMLISGHLQAAQIQLQMIMELSTTL